MGRKAGDPQAGSPDPEKKVAGDPVGYWVAGRSCRAAGAAPCGSRRPAALPDTSRQPARVAENTCQASSAFAEALRMM
jgi:hypothetical protein